MAAEREGIAITQARATGQKDLADKLEKERDIRQEITRLQTQGVGYAEAQALAEEKITAQNAEQDRKDKDRAEKRRKSADDGPVTTYGYTDPIHDAPGQLHTGRLTTSTLDGSPSVDRFAGVPDAAATALSIAPTAADALGAAPDYVPSFPTATAGFSPALARFASASASTGAGAGGDGGSASALTSVTSSANGVVGGFNSLVTALNSAVQALNSAAQNVGKGSGKGGSGGGGDDSDSSFDEDVGGIVSDLNAGL